MFLLEYFVVFTDRRRVTDLSAVSLSVFYYDCLDWEVGFGVFIEVAVRDCIVDMCSFGCLTHHGLF